MEDIDLNIIGITGSSGSGKTTLSKILNEREEVKVIDADRIVKEMSVPGTDYLNAINEKFGTEVFFEDGNLNRKALAAKIYSDNSAREELNKLTFKYHNICFLLNKLTYKYKHKYNKPYIIQ